MDTATIRSLNDRFRKRDPSVPGQTVVTRALWELCEGNAYKLLELHRQVAEYDDFSEDNDPHGEHDFGVFTFEGEKCFWKVDYYDPTLTFGSENPADTTKTMRVLTLMLASDY